MLPKRCRQAACCLVLTLASFGAHAFEPPTLVKDIDLTGEPFIPECNIICEPDVIYGSMPNRLVPFRDGVIFGANDRSSSFEPWFSDGSAEGTVVLTEGVRLDQIIGAAANRALFSVRTGNNATQYFSTDGTPAGTLPISFGCEPNCSPSTVTIAKTYGGQLFFDSTDDLGTWLYRSDGQSITTIAQLCSGSFCFRPPEEMAEAFGALFVVVGAPWKDNDVLRIDSPLASPVPILEGCDKIRGLRQFGGKLYFFAQCTGDADGNVLYVLDGPTEAPRRIRDDFPGQVGTMAIGDLAVQMAFMVDDNAIWVTDGTAQGTRALATVDAIFDYLVVLGDRVFFAGFLADIRGIHVVAPSGQASTLASGWIWSGIDVIGGRAYFGFKPEPGSLGVEPWSSDGTPGGTKAIADLAPGPAGSRVGEVYLEGAVFSRVHEATFVDNGGQIFFAADDGEHGLELWSLANFFADGFESGDTSRWSHSTH